MISFKDFVPRMTDTPGLLKPAEFESFELAVEAANLWIKETGVELVQLETVVLPNIWSHYEEGSADSSLGIPLGSPSHWNQFLRCWYRKRD